MPRSSVFSARTYGGATTAEIARAAGVTEPILYRHFGSKRELFLACVDEVWRRLREAVDEEIAAEPDPAGWVLAVPRAITTMRRRRLAPTQLWLHALSEATDDEEIRRYFRRHLREVHDYVADILRRAQAAGGIHAGPGRRRRGMDRPRHRSPTVGAGPLRRPPGGGRRRGDRLVARPLAHGQRQPIDGKNPRLRRPGVFPLLATDAATSSRTTLRLGRLFGLRAVLVARASGLCGALRG